MPRQAALTPAALLLSSLVAWSEVRVGSEFQVNDLIFRDGFDPPGCPAPPCGAANIDAVDYAGIAHGGRLVITGSGFTAAMSVTIGGVGQAFTVDADGQITIHTVADATAVGAQPLVVTDSGGLGSAPFMLTVMRLVVNELDSDTAGIDTLEFVELAAAVPGAALDGYVLVLWNGATDTSYAAIALDGLVADANGLVLIGNSAVTPPPAVTLPGNTLQNGADAVSVHQGSASSFPAGTAVTAAGLLDALVYDTADADDNGLLDTLLSPVGPQRVQVSEGATPASETVSIQRCSPSRRDGRAYTVAAPTPGSANAVAACP